MVHSLFQLIGKLQLEAGALRPVILSVSDLSDAEWIKIAVYSLPDALEVAIPAVVVIADVLDCNVSPSSNNAFRSLISTII